MRKRIQILALVVVATGGGALGGPRAAHATYAPTPPPLYCCCEAIFGVCTNRCCSPRGCTITPNGCTVVVTRQPAGTL